MSPVYVRCVEQPDSEIIAVVAALEEEAFGRGGLNEWHLPVIARYGRLYVLFEGEQIVGAASLVRDWTAGTAYLFDLVIANEARRRGYGRYLMEEVIAHIGGEDISQIELTVAPDNWQAVGLYESLGFSMTKALKDEYGKGQDRLKMVYELSADRG